MTPLPRLLFSLLALVLVLLLCGLTASVLLDWTPGATGLPADIAAIYQSGAGN
jgi:hypothetical protein